MVLRVLEVFIKTNFGRLVGKLHLYVCMYVGMYVCMYVCRYASMYVSHGNH